ncbi:hypothetical protein OHB41_50670 [Streptomyces sp. NBC_01571]|uniref:hypothetical protein n=1 Tax=Streptomyces sp. NBC_01571 TaxID=2975883 RepID=UPI0022590D72|nr:hypothetical protein [Streptomyces sp. NBC_01571]MCX4581224.1 hypothetical protein [Streptomyces sp. NBC_01571]
MFKAWREEYRANQAVKRQIELERWQQEKQWREDDRAARLKIAADNAPALAEHNGHMKTAAGVSYLTLICHEDTWTFMAQRAFGQWEPAWTQSTKPTSMAQIHEAPGSVDSTRFTVDPNLPPGRIRKLGAASGRSGLQEVLLSGHNLTQLLGVLYEGIKEDDAAASARCSRLYNKLADFVELVDPDAEAGQTTGVSFRIDDSLDAAHVTQ